MPKAIKQIAKYIRKNPESSESGLLYELCFALESGKPISLEPIFNMEPDAFDLVLRILEEWRFDRHVFGRRLEKYLGEVDAEIDAEQKAKGKSKAGGKA